MLATIGLQLAHKVLGLLANVECCVHSKGTSSVEYTSRGVFALAAIGLLIAHKVLWLLVDVERSHVGTPCPLRTQCNTLKFHQSKYP